MLEEIRGPLEDGIMRRNVDFDLWASRLSKAFPFGLNRIQWERVPNHILLVPVPRDPEERRNPESYFRRSTVRIREFVTKRFADEKIDLNEEIIWLGDSLSFALQLTVNSFLTWCHVLLSYPQHSYSIPKDVSWCLNYTWEDELFFGRAKTLRPGKYLHQ